MAIPPIDHEELNTVHQDLYLDRLSTWMNNLLFKETIFFWIMTDKLSLLSENDRNLFIRILEKCSFFHTDNKSPIIDVLTKLKEYHFNINCLNDSGRSLLTFVKDPSIYDALRLLGARYIHPKKSELQYILSKFQNLDIKNLLKKHLSNSTASDLAQLDCTCVKELLSQVENDEEIRKVFKSIFLQWQFENPVDAGRFFCQFAENGNESTVDRLMKFIGFNLLTGPVIEALCSEYQFLFAVSKVSEDNVAKLAKHGPYSVLFHSLLSAHQSVKVAIWCLILLKSRSVKELATILQYAPKNLTLHPFFRKRSLAHINAIQHVEGSTIWMHYPLIPQEHFIYLVLFGFSPLTCDKLGRNILYTPAFSLLPDEFIRANLDLSIKDCLSHNPLDHFILNPVANHNSCEIFKKLIRLGITVSSHLPHYEICYRAFPDSKIHLAQMIYLLNASPNFKSALAEINASEEGHVVIEKLKSLPQFLSRIEFLKVHNSDADSWDEKYPKEIATKLRNSINLTPNQLRYLPILFEETFPETFLTLIPGSIEASLFCSILQRLSPNDCEILHELIVRLLKTHDTIVLLFQYFFQHPELFTSFLEKMKVTELQLCPEGNVCATYILDLKTILMNLDSTHRTVHGYIRVEAPVEVCDTFMISTKAKMSFQNHTLVTESDQNKEVMNFLPRDRSLTSFLTECITLRTIVSSHQPMGSFVPQDMKIRVYRELPDLLPISLKDKLGAGPYLAHHFSFKDAETQLPYFTLENAAFKKVSAIWKRDYVDRVIRMEVPQLIPVEGEFRERKSRIILCELWSKLLASQYLKSKSSFVPTPFYAIHRLEINSGGLSNPAHIYRKAPIQKTVGDFFNPMEALTKGIEQEVVIAIYRFIQQGAKIRWNDEHLVQNLSIILLSAFSKFCTFSKKKDTEFLRFLFDVKIDWKKMAAQILFWADRSSNGYLAWLRKGELPENLFDKSIRIKIDFSSFQKYINHSRNCFEIDGHECFGIPYGPSGWVDFHKAVHLLFFMAVILPEPLENSNGAKTRRGLTMTYPQYNL